MLMTDVNVTVVIVWLAEHALCHVMRVHIVIHCLDIVHRVRRVLSRPSAMLASATIVLRVHTAHPDRHRQHHAQME